MNLCSVIEKRETAVHGYVDKIYVSHITAVHSFRCQWMNADWSRPLTCGGGAAKSSVAPHQARRPPESWDEDETRMNTYADFTSLLYNTSLPYFVDTIFF